MEHCPMCEMMKSRLDSLRVEYCLCMDVNEMLAKEIKHVPVIEDEEGALYSGKAALNYFNTHYAKENPDVR